MKQQLVYIWHDPKTNVPIYVGKGQERRPWMHFKPSVKTRLGYTLRKRRSEGYEMKPTIILANSEEESSEMEMLLIAMIGRADLGLGPLFNMTDGGEGISGLVHTPEAKAKISAANLGTQKALGYVFTDEQRAKVSAAGIGRKMTEEQKTYLSIVNKAKTPRTGWKTSEETKAKQSAAKLGKKCTDEHKANLKISNSRKVTCLLCKHETTVPAFPMHIKRNHK